MIARKPLPQTYDSRVAASTPNGVPDAPDAPPPPPPAAAAAPVETNPFKKRLVASATGSSTASASVSDPALAPPLPKAPRPESNLLIFEPGELQEAARAQALANSQPPTIPEGTSEGWNVVDNSEQPELAALSRQSSWENFTDDEDGNNDSRNANPQQARSEAAPDKEAVPAPPSAPEVVRPDQHAAAPKLVVTAAQPAEPAAPSNAPEVVPPSQPNPARNLLDVDDVGPPPGPPPTASAQPPRPRETTKTETYQVKIIRWNDGRGSSSVRESPILLQNKNGPCPLVALVNALSLSTAAESPTALVDVMKSREQVSLAFVLDAMFEDLVSGRGSGDGDGDGDSTSDMPDMAELYNFLQGLHTGMNVNPRFLPTDTVLNAYKRTSLQHLHPSMRVRAMPGTFEDTREMQLYATFGIPLIHGWLPSREADATVCEALVRQAAPSYDSVQNLFFHEAELEAKLLTPRPGDDSGDSGLTPEEQTLYQDVLTIKSFLAQSATQLTAYGIEAVATSMRPGSIAILFRNDHFSTLYRHPQTMQLMVLVTDAGYAGHDEIVWETLVDVRGERAEFYSGDFRLVGGATYDAAAAAAAAAEVATTEPAAAPAGWTTVQNSRRGRAEHGASQSVGSNLQAPALTVDEAGDPSERRLSRHEQEDRDLALALQLQEEEEEQHRAQEARRRRESQLSEQFIEQQARQRPSGGSLSSNNSNSSHTGPRHSSAGHNYYLGGSGPSLSPSLSTSGRGRRSTSSVTSLPAVSPGGLSATPSRYRGRSSTGTTPTTSTASGSAAVAALTAASASSSASQPVLAIRPSTRPPVHRPVDDDDEAPPSYEQAAQEAPYHPPGEELSPSAQRAQAMLRPSGSVSAGGSGRGSGNSSGGSVSTSGSVRRPQAQTSFPGATMVRPGVYAQQPLAGRQQQMQQYQQQQYLQQQYEDAQMRERDRDCVVM